MSIRAKLRSRGHKDELCKKAYAIIKEQDKQIVMLQAEIERLKARIESGVRVQVCSRYEEKCVCYYGPETPLDKYNATLLLDERKEDEEAEPL